VRLGLEVAVEPLLIETGIEGYQGQPFSALPRPYMAEDPVIPGIECAASIRARLQSWASQALARHGAQQIIAVSHRDPIAVNLLHWMGKGLEDLPGFELAPGGVYQVRLESATLAAGVEAMG
jgi:broad specificity phosphatase PhoE